MVTKTSQNKTAGSHSPEYLRHGCCRKTFIGRYLSLLEGNPKVQANTIVVLREDFEALIVIAVHASQTLACIRHLNTDGVTAGSIFRQLVIIRLHSHTELSLIPPGAYLDE